MGAGPDRGHGAVRVCGHPHLRADPHRGRGAQRPRSADPARPRAAAGRLAGGDRLRVPGGEPGGPDRPVRRRAQVPDLPGRVGLGAHHPPAGVPVHDAARRGGPAGRHRRGAGARAGFARRHRGLHRGVGRLARGARDGADPERRRPVADLEPGRRGRDVLVRLQRLLPPGGGVLRHARPQVPGAGRALVPDERCAQLCGSRAARGPVAVAAGRGGLRRPGGHQARGGRRRHLRRPDRHGGPDRGRGECRRGRPQPAHRPAHPDPRTGRHHRVLRGGHGGRGQAVAVDRRRPRSATRSRTPDRT